MTTYIVKGLINLKAKLLMSMRSFFSYLACSSMDKGINTLFCMLKRKQEQDWQTALKGIIALC